MRLLLPALVALAVPPGGPAQAAPAAAAVRHIEVRATGTPLSEVLDRIARQTGMKVSYEGAPPRTPVHARLDAVTPAEAVVSVLEGQGLNYLIGFDGTGTLVETLLVVSPGAASPGGSAARAMPRPRPDPPEDLPSEAAEEVDAPMGAVMDATGGDETGAGGDAGGEAVQDPPTAAGSLPGVAPGVAPGVLAPGMPGMAPGPPPAPGRPGADRPPPAETGGPGLPGPANGVGGPAFNPPGGGLGWQKSPLPEPAPAPTTPPAER